MYLNNIDKYNLEVVAETRLSFFLIPNLAWNADNDVSPCSSSKYRQFTQGLHIFNSPSVI